MHRGQLKPLVDIIVMRLTWYCPDGDMRSALCALPIVHVMHHAEKALLVGRCSFVHSNGHVSRIICMHCTVCNTHQAVSVAVGCAFQWGRCCGAPGSLLHQTCSVPRPCNADLVMLEIPWRLVSSCYLQLLMSVSPSPGPSGPGG